MQNDKISSLVYSREEYASKQFWENRYKEKQTYFDWYAEFPQLKQTFEMQYSLNHSDYILMLGCGNSRLSQQMYEEGYHNILNIDISQSVIEQMSKTSLEKGYDKMKWQVMDGTNMHSLSNHTFDAVIDKGTLDALISGKNMDICEKMLRESMRILKKDGQFILITYGSPEGRKKLFESALGLTNFDYYLTRVDLSTMSTMINLMRSNLGNKPLSSITKDSEAMKKSLLQFQLIRTLRKNRKNQKKLIVWKNFEKKQGTFHEQSETNQTQQLKQQSDQPQKIKENNQPTNKIQNKQQQINYHPRKQSFCNVYSIKRKFAIDLYEIVDQPSQSQKSISTLDNEGNIHVQGNQSLMTIGIYPQNCQQQLNTAILYLQKCGISNNPIVVYQNKQNFSKGNDDVKVIIKQNISNIIPLFTKSVFQFSIAMPDNQILKIQEKMKDICNKLIEQGGLQAHPSPQNYAYVGIIMKKIQYKLRYFQFLKQYWYPTYRLLNVDNGLAKYQISVTPTMNHQSIIEQIANILQIQHNQVTCLQKGYINYFDPRLLGLINLCVMSYHEQGYPLMIVEQYEANKYVNYSVNQPTIFLKKDRLAMILARLLSAL